MTLAQLRQLQQSAARSRRGMNRQRASILRATGREPETAFPLLQSRRNRMNKPSCGSNRIVASLPEGREAGKLVIFLDVDGVLNCSETKDRIPDNGCIGLCESRCQLLRDAVLRTDAAIVLSSTWRLHEQTSNYLWKRLGDDMARRCIGRTTDGTTPIEGSSLFRGPSREAEIMDWLKCHPEVDRFLILDDAQILSPELKTFQIKTSWAVGLTKELADAIK